MVAFMGIGLVDSILKTITVKLNATPAQTTLLFTSYMLVTGIIMLFTGFISTRIGAKKTISIGLIIIVLFAALTIMVSLEPIAKPAKKAPFFAGAVALKNHRLRSIGIIALLYNFGFFTILAYAPFLLVGLTELQVGFVFFGWGVMLAIASVFIAPRMEQKTNTLVTLLFGLSFFLICLMVIGIYADQPALVAFGVIIAGFFQGLVNTLLTTVAMENDSIERSVASSAYSFIRFTGGAIAPFVAGKIAEKWSAHWTFYFASLMILIGIFFVLRNQKYFVTVEEVEKEVELTEGQELS